MRRCAFLTTDHLVGFVTDDELALEPMRSLDWEVDEVSWRDEFRGQRVDWDQYEAVIVRTTWDYHKEPQGFVRVLEAIDRSHAQLINPLHLLRWNLHKSYLRELEAQGIRIVETTWGDHLDERKLAKLFEALRTDELVIKPAIGASADDTFRIHRDETAKNDHLFETFQNREFMAQRFLAAIVEEGEYSLFYFGGDHSHTILKTPKKDDFRVQEEHGGDIRAVVVSDDLIQRGRQLLSLLKVAPLYARVDYVRDHEDEIALMELELIEPALYFRNASHAATQFSHAFNNWMRRS